MANYPLNIFLEAWRKKINAANGLPEDDMTLSMDQLIAQLITKAWTPAGAVQNVFINFPANPVQDMAHFITAPVFDGTLEAGTEYSAQLKAQPTALSKATPLVPNGTTANGMGMVLAQDTVSNVVAALNGAYSAGITVEDGGDVDAAVLQPMGQSESMWLYLFAPAGLNGSTYSGFVSLNTAWQFTQLSEPPTALAGLWEFAQADIDSGIVEALLDLTMIPGWYYNSSATGNWVSLDGRIATLEQRVAGLDKSGT
jgi:hypothetical protein